MVRFKGAVALVLVGTLAWAKGAAEHYRERVELFERENKALDASKRHVVLVGDSLTEGFTASRVKRFLPTVGGRTLNRGIGSDGVGKKARGVLGRLDASIFDCHPDHVFLLIGVNDIGHDGKGVESTARAYETLLQKIGERAPKFRTWIVTLAPTTKRYRGMNPGILAFNKRLSEIAAATSTSLVDLHARVVDSRGELPEEMTTDGLHWKDAVYELLGKELERCVEASVTRALR